jgi:hypothetical protein
MQGRGFYTLIAATLVVLVAAIVAAASGGSGRSGPSDTDAIVFPNLSAHIAEIATVELSHGDQKVTMQRHGDGKDITWTVAEADNYAADPTRLRRTLLGLAQLKLVEAKTRKPDLLPRLDLQDPDAKDSKSTLARVKDAKGSVLAEIIVGKRRPSALGEDTDGIYVRHVGDQQAWLAAGSLTLAGEARDWIDRKVAAIPEKRVKDVSITQPDGAKVTLTREKPEDKLTIADAPPDAKYTGDYQRSEIAGMFEPLDLSDVKAAAAIELPKEGVTTAQWVTFDGLTIDASTADKDGAHWVWLKASGTDAAKAEADQLNARWSPWVFSVPDYKANAMKTKRTDLLEQPKGS